MNHSTISLTSGRWFESRETSFFDPVSYWAILEGFKSRVDALEGAEPRQKGFDAQEYLTDIPRKTRVKAHTRAVNKLALSSFLPYLFTSGSQDGHLRVWDLCTPPASTMKVYHATPIRTLAMCPVPSHPFQVFMGLEVEIFNVGTCAQRPDRWNGSHSPTLVSCCRWTGSKQPSMRESGLGWLATSGKDRRVKIWDLTLPPPQTGTSDRDIMIKSKKMGLNGPMRTLSSRFCGLMCEMASGMRHRSLRKRSFHDLRLDQCDSDLKPSSPLFYKPLDAVPRVAMTWPPKNDIAFVADKQEEEEPFADFPPPFAPTKATSDPMYMPKEQTGGTMLSSDFGVDTGTMERLARGYVLGTESNIPRIDVCEINAKRAAEEGQSSAARSKEETTAVGTLPLLDNDARHGHLQSSLHSSPHASPRQLSIHPDSSSPHLTPSPSPRGNPIALPSEPQTSSVSIYDASISSEDSESGSDNNDEDDVNGSESVGRTIPVGDGRGRTKFEETRRISSSFMESSLAKSRTSSFTTDTRSSTSLTTLHASLSFSSSPRTTSYPRRIPSPTSRSPFALQPGDTQGPTKPQSALESIVQLREGSPDSQFASEERSNGEHNDEDEHGDSNAHLGSDSVSGSGSGSGSGSESGGCSPPASRTLVHFLKALRSLRGVSLVEDASWQMPRKNVHVPEKVVVLISRPLENAPPMKSKCAES
ncbi:hypothetical protein BU17DRAFT_84894 [Hysterangium stoloniferum]|nr:hypothetical protein BU17DRAFT_84894 [Hysterangium stoloniferum]